jgi:RNA polymerase sigma factor (sigma-70 family)
VPIQASASVEGRLEEGADFDAFYESKFSLLCQALYLVTGNAVEAEDLVQEAMARAFERWHRVCQMESPTAYVYTSALNLNRNRIRALAVRSRRRSSADQLDADPAQAVEGREAAIAALRALPRKQREALVLVEWLGLSPDQAGTALRIKPVSVRGRLHRARKQLEQAGGPDE